MSYLKHRVKKIEKAIVPRQITKLWIVRESYGLDKSDIEGKKKVEKKIKAIKEGKVKHKDGSYYNKGDSFFIISRIFTDINPNKEGGESRGVNSPVEKPVAESIDEKIERLKKERADLECQIKEKENV